MPRCLDGSTSPESQAAHTNTYVLGAEKAAAFRSARAVLNNLHPAEFAGSNCRLFEIAASGGVALTEVRPGMDDLFDLGGEVIGFTSYAQLVAECHKLLDDESYGAQVADAAARRALRDHTYAHRLARILKDQFGD